MLRFEILEVICLDGILGFSRCCNELRLWEMLGRGAYILHVNGQESSEAGGIITLLGWKIPPQRCDMLLLLLSRFSRVRLCVTPWQQPTRLPRPWDSPGKNTGLGCHFLLQCVKVKSESEVAQSCLTLSDPTDCSLPGSSIHGIFQARVLEWGAFVFSEDVT